MDEITLPATINDDRKLIVDVPQTIPSGPVQVTIRPIASNGDSTTERDRVRTKLKAAHFLAPDMPPPSDVERLDSQELLAHGKLPPNARSSEDLIDEDRGSY